MMQISMPLPLWDEAIAWVSAATVKTPAAGTKNDTHFGLHLFTVDHPHHFDADWQPVPAPPGVTLLATDRYRMCWASLPASDLVTITTDDGWDSPARVPLHLPAVLHAMKGWPRLALKAAYTATLTIDDTATLTLSEGQAVISESRIALHTGNTPTLTPAWFSKNLAPGKRSTPFALNPTLLAPLAAAAAKAWRGEAMRFRTGAVTGTVLLSRKPTGDAPLLASGLQMGVKQ